jgi:hypothetical protein
MATAFVSMSDTLGQARPVAHALDLASQTSCGKSRAATVLGDLLQAGGVDDAEVGSVNAFGARALATGSLVTVRSPKIAARAPVQALDAAHRGTLLGKLDTGAGPENIDYLSVLRATPPH